jgi:hypothetical protein
MQAKPRALELFCGFKSVSKACPQFEWFSLDIVSKYNPTVTADILVWDYVSAFSVGFFDVVWASPPCVEYSIAKRQGVRNLALADSIVRRTREIIAYFKPRAWFIENPQTGLLKYRGLLDDVQFYDFHYCCFGFVYRKPTRIWTNLNALVSVKCNPKTCAQMLQNPKSGRWIHICTPGHFGPPYNMVIPLSQKYAIPDSLVRHLLLGEPVPPVEKRGKVV